MLTRKRKKERKSKKRVKKERTSVRILSIPSCLVIIKLGEKINPEMYCVIINEVDDVVQCRCKGILA